MADRTRAWTVSGNGPRFLMLVAIVAFLAPGSAAGAESRADDTQTAGEADPWAPLELLLGSWEGAIDGRLGTGRGIRRYERVVGGKYVLMRHSSVRPPQQKSPAGDQHQELAIFSFDRERGKIVLREFMIEGVVTRCECEMEPKRFVCTSESVESGPGIRSRLTVEIEDRYRFREIYELAFPGKELAVFFNIQWTRLPELD